jgi:hypothetical protein
MILFFVATTLFHGDEEKIEQKTFNTEINATQKKQAMQKEEAAHAAKPKFKLLKKGY